MSSLLEQRVTLHLPPRREAGPIGSGRWSVKDVQALFELSFPDLLHRAQAVHRENFDPTQVEFATLLSVKTGGCAEDCGYCPQSAKYDTGVEASKLMEPAEVLQAAQRAKDAGATRFCMGAAWRGPKDRDIEKVAELVSTVKALGLETCATLGMLEDGHAQTLRDAGLDYYNHNLDSAPDFYGDIITTRDYQDRLDTLGRVRSAGVKVCCGGIVGMGEQPEDRAELLSHRLDLLGVEMNPREQRDFLDLLGATNLIPGPNSTEMAIHIGHRRRKIKSRRHRTARRSTRRLSSLMARSPLSAASTSR